MMFRIRVGDSHALLNLDQLDKLINILDGATCVTVRYKGDEKGSFGHSMAYELDFEPYNVPSLLGTLHVFTDQDVDKYTTLAAIRKQEKEN